MRGVRTRNTSWIITHTTPKIADSSNEADLRHRRTIVAPWKQIVDFTNLPFDGSLEVLLSEFLAGGILEGPYVLANHEGRAGEDSAVLVVEAKWIKVAVLEAPFAFDEHVQCFRLVGFYGSDGFFEHGFGFRGGAAGLLSYCGGREHERVSHGDDQRTC